jgi:hypothetical protein
MDSTFTEIELDDLKKNVLLFFLENEPLSFLALLNQYRKISGPKLQNQEELKLNLEILDLHIALNFLLDNLFIEYYKDICFYPSYNRYVITAKGEKALM